MKIIGSQPFVKTEIFSDAYVPLSFECAEAKSLHNFYWRAGNNKKFVEIGINPKSGAIFSVTILLLPTLSEETAIKDICSNSEIKKIKELPICDISQWNDKKFTDEASNFKTCLSNSSFYIFIKEDPNLKLLYEVNNLSLGVDFQDELCVLKFASLNNSQIMNVINSSGL